MGPKEKKEKFLVGSKPKYTLDPAYREASLEIFYLAFSTSSSLFSRALFPIILYSYLFPIFPLYALGLSENECQTIKLERHLWRNPFTVAIQNIYPLEHKLESQNLSLKKN